MKPILTLAVAAAMAFTGQPLYAAHGKSHGGHRQAARHAPAAHARIAHQAPRARPHARPNVAQRSKAIAHNRARVQQHSARMAQRRAVATQQRARTQANIAARQRANRASAVAQQRAHNRATVAARQNAKGTQAITQQRARNRAKIATRNRTRIQNHSIAFGGNRTHVNNRVDVRNLSYYHPPVDVYRHWNHDRIHAWNNHRYHWYDGAWVVIDASPNYYYDTAPTVVLSSGVSSDLVAQVQSALDRRGYDAGPVDGIAGAQTRDAIATYQADNGLAATGNINDTLLRSLNL